MAAQDVKSRYYFDLNIFNDRLGTRLLLGLHERLCQPILERLSADDYGILMMTIRKPVDDVHSQLVHLPLQQTQHANVYIHSASILSIPQSVH